MENQFDFYAFQVSSSRKSDLTKAGVARDSIQTKKDGWAVYGAKRFPRWIYFANVGFMDAVVATSEKVDQKIAELEKKYGMNVHAIYIVRD